MSDQVDIRQVLERNAFGLDRRDYAAVAGCYTEDATAEFGGEALSSVAEIVKYASDRLATFVSSMHHITTHEVVVEGDSARSESYAIAYLVRDDPAGQQVVIRGVRYVDRFARVDSSWRIAYRQHLPQWMVVHPTTPLQ